jgi:hypothetical protein
MTRTHVLTAAVLAGALIVSAALAQQQPQTPRVSGTIERVDGNTIYGKGPDRSAITLKLADNVTITAVFRKMDDFLIGASELYGVRGSKDDLKAGAAFLAQVATKQPDGSYTASAISVGRDGARPF